MKPLKIALVHRDHPRHTWGRMIGMWAYDVPCLDVTHVPQPREFTLNRDNFVDVDAVVWEDARVIGTVTGGAPVPVVYMVGDSTLTDDNYQDRFAQAQQSDLILVDWDRLDRFEGTGKPVKRLAYCVNERLFYPRDKVIDVGFYCNITDERRDLHEWLATFCAARGYTFAGGRRVGEDYCQAIGETRVNVNLNRNPETRAHRCYDVMASRSCLVTSPMPHVSGEDWINQVHYLEWTDWDHLGSTLDAVLSSGLWESIATRAYAYAHAHTWAVRAAELYTILTEFISERVQHVY